MMTLVITVKPENTALLLLQRSVLIARLENLRIIRVLQHALRALREVLLWQGRRHVLRVKREHSRDILHPYAINARQVHMRCLRNQCVSHALQEHLVSKAQRDALLVPRGTSRLGLPLNAQFAEQVHMRKSGRHHVRCVNQVLTVPTGQDIARFVPKEVPPNTGRHNATRALHSSHVGFASPYVSGCSNTRSGMYVLLCSFVEILPS